MKFASFKLITNLTFWVLLAVIAGILLGNYFPATAVRMEPLGVNFVALVKLFIGPIIFLTIVLGISGMSNLGKAGKIGVRAIVYFEIVTTLALGIGILVANIIQPGKIDRLSLAAQNAAKYTSKATQGIDWGEFFKSNLTLQVLVFAIITGIVLHFVRNRHKIIAWLEIISDVVFRLLKWAMYLAPLGAFGGMAFTIGKYGLHSLVPLGKLMLSVYCTMLVFIFLVLGVILHYYKENIWRYLKNIKEELLIVLGTSSSEAALPSMMNKLEQMGCSKPVVGLVIPAGYSFNLDGTSIYLSMSVIFLSQLYNVHLSITEILSIIGILMITSKGAAGITGSGFIILVSTLSAIHKIPIEGVSFLLGIDRFMSEARALTNLVGNGVATIVIAKSEKEFKVEGESLVAV